MIAIRGCIPDEANAVGRTTFTGLPELSPGVLPEGRPDTVGVGALNLPEDPFMFSGCLHTRHPACCAGAELNGLAPCVMHKKTVGGPFAVVYHASRVSGASSIKTQRSGCVTSTSRLP